MPKALFLVIIVVFVSGVFLGGCVTAKKNQPAVEKSTEPYRLESEGEVPPLTETDIQKEVDKVETFEEMPVTDDAVRNNADRSRA